MYTKSGCLSILLIALVYFVNPMSCYEHLKVIHESGRYINPLTNNPLDKHVQKAFVEQLPTIDTIVKGIAQYDKWTYKNREAVFKEHIIKFLKEFEIKGKVIGYLKNLDISREMIDEYVSFIKKCHVEKTLKSIEKTIRSIIEKQPLDKDMVTMYLTWLKNNAKEKQEACNKRSTFKIDDYPESIYGSRTFLDEDGNTYKRIGFLDEKGDLHKPGAQKLLREDGKFKKILLELKNNEITVKEFYKKINLMRIKMHGSLIDKGEETLKKLLYPTEKMHLIHLYHAGFIHANKLGDVYTINENLLKSGITTDDKKKIHKAIEDIIFDKKESQKSPDTTIPNNFVADPISDDASYEAYEPEIKKIFKDQ